jgi:hypothetical protein
MQELGIDISGQESKTLDHFDRTERGTTAVARCTDSRQ